MERGPGGPRDGASARATGGGGAVEDRGAVHIGPAGGGGVGRKISLAGLAERFAESSGGFANGGEALAMGAGGAAAASGAFGADATAGCAAEGPGAGGTKSAAAEGRGAGGGAGGVPFLAVVGDGSGVG